MRHEPMGWAEIRERADELHGYLSAAVDREKAADARTAALVTVHERGWRLLAEAVRAAGRDIAAAIRGSHR